MKHVVLISFLFLLGCGSGPCRNEKKSPTPAENLAMTQSKPTDRVRVYKADGSLQCGMGKAIPAETMKAELKDIQIYSSDNKSDGLMRTQVCGTPTGRANVYEINRSDLEKAKKLGFKEWTWD